VTLLYFFRSRKGKDRFGRLSRRCELVWLLGLRRAGLILHFLLLTALAALDFARFIFGLAG